MISNIATELSRPILIQCDTNSCGPLSIDTISYLLKINTSRNVMNEIGGSSIQKMRDIRLNVIDRYIAQFKVAKSYNDIIQHYIPDHDDSKTADLTED